MENMENNEQINQEVQNNEQQTDQNVDVTTTNEGGIGTEKVNQETNLEEWQKDGRFGKMWKTHDDVYNSYKSLEKSFNDVNPKYTNLVKVLKDNGFSAETLADELKKYADYRNPDSRINQVYNYVNGFLNNDIYSSRIQQFFEQLEQEELQRLYPNMNAEQIAKQQAMDKEIKELKEREAQRQEQLSIQKDIDTINKGLQECETLAKQYGFKLTKEVRDYLITYCRDNDIDPRYVRNEFISIYGNKLLEARDKKVIENQQQNKKKLEEAKILGGGNNKQATTPNLKGKSALTEGLMRILGK